MVTNVRECRMNDVAFASVFGDVDAGVLKFCYHALHDGRSINETERSEHEDRCINEIGFTRVVRVDGKVTDTLTG